MIIHSLQLGKGATISRRWSNTLPRGIIHKRVSNEKLHKIVQKRSCSGDIEVDFIMCMNHKGALQVMTERVIPTTRCNWLEHIQIYEARKVILTKLKKAE